MPYARVAADGDAPCARSGHSCTVVPARDASDGELLLFFGGFRGSASASGRIVIVVARDHQNSTDRSSWRCRTYGRKRTARERAVDHPAAATAVTGDGDG